MQALVEKFEILSKQLREKDMVIVNLQNELHEAHTRLTELQEYEEHLEYTRRSNWLLTRQPKNLVKGGKVWR